MCFVAEYIFTCFYMQQSFVRLQQGFSNFFLQPHFLKVFLCDFLTVSLEP